MAMSEETKKMLRDRKARSDEAGKNYLNLGSLAGHLDKVCEEQFGVGAFAEVATAGDTMFSQNPGTRKGYCAEARGGKTPWEVEAHDLDDAMGRDRRPDLYPEHGLCRVRNAHPDVLGWLTTVLPHRWVLVQSGGDTEVVPAFPYRVMYAVLKSIGFTNPDKFLATGASRLLRTRRQNSRDAGRGLCTRDQGPVCTKTIRDALVAMRWGMPRRLMSEKAAERLRRMFAAGGGHETLDNDPQEFGDLSMDTLIGVTTYRDTVIGKVARTVY